MEWIIHLDTDELIHPSGTHEYSLRKLLGNISANVDAVVFPNYVSLTGDRIFIFMLKNASSGFISIVLVSGEQR